MRKEAIEEIKQKLLKEKENLLSQNGNQKINKEDTVDSIDFANAQNMQNVVSFMNFKNKKHIEKIDKALRKIEENKFGCCDDCGVDISSKRLKANPNAILCIDCQEEQESEAKQYRAA